MPVKTSKGTPSGVTPSDLESGAAVDVNEIAKKFGGGGHRMASGTYLPAPLEHAMQLIHDEVAKRLA